MWSRESNWLHDCIHLLLPLSRGVKTLLNNAKTGLLNVVSCISPTPTGYWPVTPGPVIKGYIAEWRLLHLKMKKYLLQPLVMFLLCLAMHIIIYHLKNFRHSSWNGVVHEPCWFGIFQNPEYKLTSSLLNTLAPVKHARVCSTAGKGIHLWCIVLYWASLNWHNLPPVCMHGPVGDRHSAVGCTIVQQQWPL